MIVPFLCNHSFYSYSYIIIVGSDCIMTLDCLKMGNKAKIVSLENTGTIRRRLLDMGLTPGTIIECVLESPFKDPIAYKVRNATIVLRKEDSKLIRIEVLSS